jgi:hypothetical protein
MFAATTRAWYLPTWGQRPDAGDFADCPRSIADAQAFVDGYAVRVRLDAHRSVDLDCTGPGQPAGATEQGDVVVGQGGLDIHLGGRGRIAGLVDRLTRSQQCRRGNAGPVGALAADKLALDHGHAQSAVGQGARAVLAG